VAALLLAGLLRAGAAVADEPDAEQKAKANAHLKHGAELIDAENLEGALAEFEAAYRLVPSPAILHNFGIVYQGLGRKAAALDAFQRFLDEASRAPPGTREHAQRAVQALRAEVAELRVQTEVTGASIFVDGRKVGETPQEKPIHLDPGPHHLSVEKAGVGTVHTERLVVKAGQSVMVPARSPRAAPVVEAKRSVPPAEVRGWQRPAAWATAVGGGVAAGVFGTAILVRYLKFTSYNDMRCGRMLPDEGGPDCVDARKDGEKAGKWALVSGVVAGALGAGAAVLFFTLPETDGGRAVSLSVAPGHLGLRLQGRF
jgi:hypothetical protein